MVQLKKWFRGLISTKTRTEKVDRVICAACAGTGFTDKVNRGFFAPGDCDPCNTSGWVNPQTGRR